MPTGHPQRGSSVRIFGLEAARGSSLRQFTSKLRCIGRRLAPPPDSVIFAAAFLSAGLWPCLAKGPLRR